MLNRRILRIKAFKALYSYAENPGMELKEVLSQFDSSCEATRSLYVLMLAIIPELSDEAARRIEAALGKFNPQEGDLNPNMKFVGNALSATLKSDPDFQKELTRRKLSWDGCDVFLRNTFTSISTKEYYKEYMASGENSIAEDVRLFIRIFEEEFVDSAELEKILEDRSIYWNDELPYALTCCCNTLKDLARGRGWALPPLYQSEIIRLKDPTAESDRDFIRSLLRHACSSYSKYFDMVAQAVRGWDSSRLFTTDIVLIILGLAEAEHCPSIPVKVTINEYVDISKFYGTPRSRSFVNGLLDTLVQKMVSEGRIAKNA